MIFEDNGPRWILNPGDLSLSLILCYTKDLAAKEEAATYSDMGHLLMTGALWEIGCRPGIYRLRRRDDCCFGCVRKYYVY
jgi:hypothetical protein